MTKDSMRVKEPPPFPKLAVLRYSRQGSLRMLCSPPITPTGEVFALDPPWRLHFPERSAKMQTSIEIRKTISGCYTLA